MLGVVCGECWVRFAEILILRRHWVCLEFVWAPQRADLQAAVGLTLVGLDWLGADLY